MLELENVQKEMEAKDVSANIKKTLKEIEDNIQDKATHPTNVRVLTIEYRIYPNSEREQCEIEIDVKGKLAKRIAEPRISTIGKHKPLPMTTKDQPTLADLANQKKEKESKDKKGKV